MTDTFPDGTRAYPVTLPDGGTHPGTVFLNRVIDHPRWEVGDFTYASDFEPPQDWAQRLAPYLFAGGAERLVIGKYCQIAHGVRFVTSGGNHARDGLTTFPFPIFDPAQISDYQPDSRDTIIGHDVWLGYGAVVCPGARIGNGVIVGAGSVVRGIIPDFSIALGNPAQVVRRRFCPDDLARIQRLSWWDWPPEQVAIAVPALLGGDLDALESLGPVHD